jgi:DNA repair protein RadA/Sms
MMKQKTFFVCQSCGNRSLKWLGRCPACNEWNTLVEEVAERPSKRRKSVSTTPVPLTEITFTSGERRSTGIGELDRVLGGGLVAGSLVLIGGDPGVGKSTLLLQAVDGYLSGDGSPALYISGEESAPQIKLRAGRMNIDSDNILILPETSLENILSAMEETGPAVTVVDSIQTIQSEELSSAPGTVAQVRECAARLMETAKRLEIPTLIIGHVTKEGAIAGPRVLEHLVDTVLYFEGDRSHTYRILRAVKNRFGSTNEIGIFEMTDRGLTEIQNPSELFMSEKTTEVPGTLVTSTIEGTRPIIVEIQALVSPTSFGMPRRTAIGVDYQRVNLLIAVLEKIGGLQLGLNDIYVNVVGGLRVVEPATDLPIALSIASSLLDIPLRRDMIAFGEIGLSGEIRNVSNSEQRIKEGIKTGFRSFLMPRQKRKLSRMNEAVEYYEIEDIHQALEMLKRG